MKHGDHLTAGALRVDGRRSTTNVVMTVPPSETNTAPNLAIRLPSEDRPPPPHHYEPVTSIGETDAITGTGGLTTTRARIRR